MKKTISLLLVLSLVSYQLFSMPFHEVNPSTVLTPFQKKAINNSEKETTRLKNYSMDQSQNSTVQLPTLNNQSKNSEISETEMNDLIDSALNKLDNAKITTIDAKGDLISAASKVKENSEQIEILAEDSKIKEATIDNLKSENSSLEKKVAEKDGRIKELNNDLYSTHFFTTVGSTYNLQDGFGIGLNAGYTFGRGGIVNIGLSAPIDTFTNPFNMTDITSYTANASIGWIW